MSLNRILFLDIDGVINHSAFFSQLNTWLICLVNPDNMIDPECVCRLNRILDATGALVVVSSTWRVGKTPDELQALLEKFGFTGKVIGTTPDLLEQGCDRGDEILSWVQGQYTDINYIVLDDEEVWAVRSRQIKTDYKNGGLLDEHVEKAIEMFNASL